MRCEAGAQPKILNDVGVLEKKLNEIEKDPYAHLTYLLSLFGYGPSFHRKSRGLWLNFRAEMVSQHMA